MHLFTGLKTFKLWLDNKKGDLPGWAYVIALIIGLFVILVALYVAWRAGRQQTGWLEDIFG